MAQTFFPVDPVEVTPGTAGAWTVVNGADFGVPVGATGVLIHVVCTSTTTARYVGLRKKGSTDNRVGQLTVSTHCWAAIGVDGDRKFEAYVQSTTAIDLYLVGYTMSGVVFFDNAYNKSIPHIDDFTDIDCHTEAPNAIGLIFEIYDSSSQVDGYFLRKKGSTDYEPLGTYRHNAFGAITGCDASQICQGWVSNASVGFFLVGYITDGATFPTNAINITPSTIGDWTDLAALPANSVMGFISVLSYPTYGNYGLRKNGSSEDIYLYAYTGPFAFVGCDASQLIEGKVQYSLSGANIEGLLLVGYAWSAAPPAAVGRSYGCIIG